jgi:P-type Cu+ transporter
MAAAPVTFMSGNLQAVARAIALAQATIRTIKQNRFWTSFYNVILIPEALGYLMPILATGAMAFGSIFVVFRSLRLRRLSLSPPQDDAHDPGHSSPIAPSAPAASSL